MAQCLRVIAQHLAAGGIDLFAEQAELTAQALGERQQLFRLVHETTACERIDKPEAAGDKGALPGRPAVSTEVAVDKRIAGPQMPAHGVDGRLDAVRAA